MEPKPLSELFETLRNDRVIAKRLLERQGRLLKRAREEAGLNQTAFANAAGVSAAYVSMVESGERTISTPTLDRMEQALATNQTGGPDGQGKGSNAKQDAAQARKRKK